MCESIGRDGGAFLTFLDHLYHSVGPEAEASCRGSHAASLVRVRNAYRERHGLSRIDTAPTINRPEQNPTKASQATGFKIAYCQEMALYVRSLESQQKRQCREVMCPAAPAVDYGSLASWDLLSVQKQNERKLKLRSAVKHSSFGQRRPTWSTLGTKWQNLGKRRPDGDAWRELECPELVEEISGEVVSLQSVQLVTRL
jgi:hypothetical protein